MRDHGNRKVLSRASLALLLVAALACETDSPTAPVQNPQPPSGGATAWTITLSSNPSELPAGTQSSTIAVTVRRTSDNSAPAPGTTLAVFTDLGEFISLGSGTQSVVVTLSNGQGTVSFFGGTTPGTANIQAQLENSVGRLQVAITGVPNFFLDHIVPNFGSPAGGQTAEIIGGGFIAPVRVTFNSTPATIVSVTNSSIVVETPPANVAVGSTLTVTVAVTVDVNGENQQSDSLANSYTYSHGSLNQPAIFSISPTEGPNEGGTRVVINGDGFEPPVQVIFGSGSSATNFSGVEANIQSISRTQIVVTSPAATAFGQSNLNQAVDVLVKNQDSGLFAIATGGFRYGVTVLVTAISPGAGPYFGGQTVTLFGQGFDEPVAVELAGFGQQILSVTGTEIVLRTAAISSGGCADVQGPAVVTNIETGDTTTEGPNYTYLVVSASPLIGSLVPNSGSILGGDTVVLGGSGFRDPLSVTFDGRSAQVVSVTVDNRVELLTPFLPLDALQTEPCDDNLDGQMGERYLPTAVDVEITTFLTTCSSTFVEGFFYTPTDTTCRDDIAPPPPPPPPPTPPVAAFSASPITSGGFDVLFDAGGSTDATSYSWNFGDGTVGSGQVVIHNYTPAGAGSYAVILTVSGPGGTAQSSTVVTVPNP